jgi:hypothetical protein
MFIVTFNGNHVIPSNTEIGSGFVTVTDLNIPVNFQLSAIMNGGK